MISQNNVEVVFLCLFQYRKTMISYLSSFKHSQTWSQLSFDLSKLPFYFFFLSLPSLIQETLYSGLFHHYCSKPHHMFSHNYMKSESACQSFLFIYLFIYLFTYLFFNLYWILSYTEMKQPWVYMCSPSQSCNPMGYSLPGSSVHGILQARILEWVNFPFFRGFSQPTVWTQVSHIASS